MGFTRAELERAFASYCALREQAIRSGDWGIWGNQFSDDARYLEHAYGELHGREAIVAWIRAVMEPFPTMTFPNDWVVYDEARGWVVFQCQNRLEHPTDPKGAPFQFPTWSLLHYAGGGRWSYEEDMYNAKAAAETIQGWIKAGGKLAVPERVKMKSR